MKGIAFPKIFCLGFPLFCVVLSTISAKLPPCQQYLWFEVHLSHAHVLLTTVSQAGTEWESSQPPSEENT